jgi:hypothetical protein
MGKATTITDRVLGLPLSPAELEERRQAAIVREDVTTTLDGDVVERVTPVAAPTPVRRREAATWD